MTPPELSLWSLKEVEERSHASITAYATENGITVIPLGVDHAERAWRRYFQADLPFNAEEPDREKRRKDIPDSWILEAAIDLKSEYSTLIVLCCDKRFAAALEKTADASVFEDAQAVFDHVDATTQSRTTDTPVSEVTTPIEAKEEPASALAAAFTGMESQFRLVATKIIGLVAFLGSPTKDQLYTLLERSGIPTSISQNISEQLALAKIIIDTGNHFISGDKVAGEQAKIAVETEIIRLVTDGT